MKTLSTLIIAFFITSSIFAQSSQVFNYQGIARDLAGNSISEQNIGLRFAILSGSAQGTEVYTETHSVSTNSLGLFKIEIGNGTATNGAMSNINWGDNIHFLQIEMDEIGGSNYELIGTSQLLSVPYALHAENGSKWGENNSGLYYDEGNVGIGTDDLSAKLNVNSSDVDAVNVYLSNSTPAGVQIVMNAEESGGHEYKIVASSDANTNGNAGALGIKDETAVADVGNQAAWRFLINSEGNIGISNTDPKSKLQVSDGDIYIEDINKGVIMKSPNGQCWRYTPDNTGQLTPTMISCPN